MSSMWACLIAAWVWLAIGGPGLLWVSVGWFDKQADQMQLLLVQHLVLVTSTFKTEEGNVELQWDLSRSKWGVQGVKK